jgi:hypothetical protein
MFTSRWSGDLSDMASDLRRGRRNLPKAIVRELKKPAERVTKRIQKEVKVADMSARRVGEPQFRARMRSEGVKKPTAAALEWKVTAVGSGASVQISFRESKIPQRIRALFPYWVGKKTRLRHSIMGHRKGRWVQQNLPPVWHHSKELIPGAQFAVRKAVGETADIIGGRK